MDGQFIYGPTRGLADAASSSHGEGPGAVGVGRVVAWVEGCPERTLNPRDRLQPNTAVAL